MPIDPRKRAAKREAEGKSSTPSVGEGGPPRVNTECKVPGAVVGWEQYESSAKGTPGTLVRFVVLDGPEKGKITETTFWKTPKTEDQWADLALSFGYMEPFDWNNEDHLQNIFTSGAVMLDIRGESYIDREGNERTSYKPVFLGKYDGKPSKDWNEIVQAGEEGWARYLQWRANNPRPSPGSSSGGGGGSSQSGRFGNGGGGYDDDGIPF